MNNLFSANSFPSEIVIIANLPNLSILANSFVECCAVIASFSYPSSRDVCI